MLILIAALTTHCILLTAYSLHKIKGWVSSDLQVVADMIAQQSASATHRRSVSEVQAILANLRSKEDIRQAAILTNDNRTLGRYQRLPVDSECTPIGPSERKLILEFCGVTLLSPIERSGETVGFVGVQIDMGSVRLEVLTIAIVDLALSLILTLLTIPIWRRLAGQITQPLRDLVSAIGLQAKNGLYPVPVRSGTCVEVVALYEGFNCMITQLAERDRSLRHELEHRSRAERRLTELAYVDPVTGLHNRHHFREAIEAATRDGVARGTRGALLCIDLDGFKSVNDSLGHDAGDQLLIEVGKRLRRHLRETDVVCRTGGDEFAVLIWPLSIPETADSVAEKLVQALAEPYQEQTQQTPTVTASIGMALFPDDAAEAGALMQAADQALYRAKAAGRCCHRRAESGGEKARERRLMDDLPFALSRQEMFLVFQPKIRLLKADDPSKFQTVGVEALLRWRHPQLGLINPNEFIGIAEANGHIVTLGHWVLEMACRRLVDWRSSAHPGLRMSVNLSPRQLADSSAIDALKEVLAVSRLPPDVVELELTESAFVDRCDVTVNRLHGLRAAGFGLSVDDFGTGYSSLANIASFPVTTLKLDRTFVERIVDDPRRRAIASAVIALAKALELQVVAEGIEVPEQVAALARIDTGLQLQGYLFGKPMDEIALKCWLASVASDSPQLALSSDFMHLNAHTVLAS